MGYITSKLYHIKYDFSVSHCQIFGQCLYLRDACTILSFLYFNSMYYMISSFLYIKKVFTLLTTVKIKCFRKRFSTSRKQTRIRIFFTTIVYVWKFFNINFLYSFYVFFLNISSRNKAISDKVRFFCQSLSKLYSRDGSIACPILSFRASN